MGQIKYIYRPYWKTIIRKTLIVGLTVMGVVLLTESYDKMKGVEVTYTEEDEVLDVEPEEIVCDLDS
jgi:hypothetical protein